VSLDFVEGLPMSHGYNCILIVVDLFSKFSHFIAVKHPFTALSIAKLFMTNVYRLHGLPTALVSNHDKIFTSTLWRELFRLAGVSLRLSSAYHPQSDGQTERVNQCMETFLRCFANAAPAKWFDYLHPCRILVQLHLAFDFEPITILCPLWSVTSSAGIDSFAACSMSSLDEWLQQKTAMQALIQQQLARAKSRTKLQADKNHIERVFTVGTWVYIKLQPYVQSSVAARSNKKLAYRFFGPYQILEKIGTIAYKLQLPAGSAIHPVFHVSQLKGAIPVTQVAQPLPVSLDGPRVPERVLQKRVATSGAAVWFQALVQWSGMPESLVTWEDVEGLRQRFPCAPAWGQAGPQEGGMSALLLLRQLKKARPR
jgi:hypothetical protein